MDRKQATDLMTTYINKMNSLPEYDVLHIEKVQKAGQFLLNLLELDEEALKIEEFGGRLTAVVALSQGLVTTDEHGVESYADVVRIRVPTTSDEWKTDAALAARGMTNDGSGLALMMMVKQVIVNWPGVPMPDIDEHMAALSRFDSVRLWQAMDALERHAERVAIEKKASRRALGS